MNKYEVWLRRLVYLNGAFLLLATFAVFLPAWYLLHGFGNHGLWIALLLFFAARGASMAWYCLKLDRRGAFI